MFCLLLPLWIPKSIVVVNPKAWIVWGVWVGMSPLRNPPMEEEVPPCYFSLLILEIKLNLCSDGRLEPKFAQIFVNILVIWIFCSISAEMVWTKSNSRWRASISWEMKMRRRSSSTIRFLGAEREILGTKILARKTNVQIVWTIKEIFFKFGTIRGFLSRLWGNSGYLWKFWTQNVYLYKLLSWQFQAETAFDQIVGAIEDIVIDDRFQDLQTDLLEKHFHHFDVSTSAKTKKKTEFKTPKLIC